MKTFIILLTKDLLQDPLLLKFMATARNPGEAGKDYGLDRIFEFRSRGQNGQAGMI